jgi:subtilase-type serine protease
VRSYSLTTYGTWFEGDLHIDASTTASFNRYTISRYIQFPGVNRIAGSRHDGYSLTPHLGIGYDFHLPYNITLEPFAGVDYMLQREQAYTEAGGGDLNNAIKGKVSTMLRTEVGTNISHTFKMDEGANLSLSAKLSYICKSSRNDQKMTASFVGQSGAFMIEGSSKVRQQMAAALEGTYSLADDTYLMTRYSGEYGRRYQAHEVVVKLGKRF